MPLDTAAIRQDIIDQIGKLSQISEDRISREDVLGKGYSFAQIIPLIAKAQELAVAVQPAIVDGIPFPRLRVINESLKALQMYIDQAQQFNSVANNAAVQHATIMDDIATATDNFFTAGGPLLVLRAIDPASEATKQLVDAQAGIVQLDEAIRAVFILLHTVVAG